MIEARVWRAKVWRANATAPPEHMGLRGQTAKFGATIVAATSNATKTGFWSDCRLASPPPPIRHGI